VAIECVLAGRDQETALSDRAYRSSWAVSTALCQDHGRVFPEIVCVARFALCATHGETLFDLFLVMTALKSRPRRGNPPLKNHDAPLFPPGTRAYTAHVRVIRRLWAIAIWAVAGCSLQTLLVHLPGTAKIRFARFFWRGVCRLLGVRVRVEGDVAGTIRGRAAVSRGEKPVIFVANHSSWLDILVAGGVLPTVFVSKDDVGRWPVMGTIARLGRTIFVSRQRGNTGRELEEMASRLRDGDNLILFPEGTSTDGSRVLPFLSSFFAIAKPGRLEQTGMPTAPPTIIQPVSIVYDRLENLPVGRARRTVFSWYGDMDLGPHVWKLGQWRSMRATIRLHPPLDPNDFKSRKALANECWRIVNEGAAELRHDSARDA